ncbi:hypothetical protein ABT185_07525 [Streptomyces clavifer]|uniref:hypothetical protein n=1 Tax=Streptomyces clavifer TaxID=68188 RepID=UPI00332ED9BB
MSAYPLPDGRQITGALTTTFGRQLKDLTWAEPPKAKYECFLCEHTVTVTGAEAVTRFGQTIRPQHWATCPGYPTQGAQAA